MKRVIKKLGITLIIIITTLMMLKSTLYPYAVLAEEYSSQASEEANVIETLGSGIADVGDFLLGLALIIPKSIGIALASLLRGLVYTITLIGGDGISSVDAIIFNESELTSIDFFDVSDNDTVNKIRTNISIWYYVFRNLAIVILLGILLYVGIRMAISTVAADEAKYKKMFKDWAVSLALVFVLQYIMIFTIEINNVLVDILDTARTPVQTGSPLEGTPADGTVLEDATTHTYDNALNQIAGQAWHISFSVGVGSTIVYIILVGVTILFLIMYIKRMLTVGFLIVISPLITITYSIDKMGDGKSQALNAWLKEFVFNVLIQPFHCIIYLVFSATAIDLLIEQGTLSAAVLSVCMLVFIFSAEKIIKNIFGFKASSLGEAIGGAAVIATGMSLLKSKGDKDKKKNVDTKKLPSMNKPADKTGGASNRQGGNNNSAQNTRSSSTSTSSTSSSTSNTSTSSTSTSTSQSGNPVPSGNGQSNNQSQNKFANAVKSVGGKALHPLRTLKNGANTALNAGERLYSKLPQAMKDQLAWSAKVATIGTMAALGASTGSGKSIMAGIHAGESMSEGAGANLNERTANRLVMQNEQKFAQAYQNFKASKPGGMTDQEIALKTQHMLEHGDFEKMDANEREYYDYVKQMSKTYSAVGEGKVADRMDETLALIASGQIQPPKPPKKKKGKNKP